MEDYNLSGFYKENFPLLQQYLQALDQLTKEAIPDLAVHFAKQSLSPSDFLQQWFLTLFITCLPLPAVLIIWDVIICNGGLQEALMTMLALLKTLKCILISKPFEEMLTFFESLKSDVLKGTDCDGEVIGQLLMRETVGLSFPHSQWL